MRMNPSEHYRAAAAELTQVAAALEGGDTDAGIAVEATVRLLGGLTEVEPDRGTVEALHGLGERLRVAGATSPEKLREIVGVLHRVADNHDGLEGELVRLWS